MYSQILWIASIVLFLYLKWILFWELGWLSWFIPLWYFSDSFHKLNDKQHSPVTRWAFELTIAHLCSSVTTVKLIFDCDVRYNSLCCENCCLLIVRHRLLINELYSVWFSIVWLMLILLFIKHACFNRYHLYNVFVRCQSAKVMLMRQKSLTLSILMWYDEFRWWHWCCAKLLWTCRVSGSALVAGSVEPDQSITAGQICTSFCCAFPVVFHGYLFLI